MVRIISINAQYAHTIIMLFQLELNMNVNM